MDLVSTRHGRLWVFGALYLSEGAPIGFIWWALPTVLRARGEAVDKITAFAALLVWPWTLKFLWAPIVDALRGRRWGHRYWILVAQAVMGVALLPLLFLDVQENLDTVFWLLLLHALAATTQDVAIDAWAIGVTPPVEHGRLNAAMAAGKYVGRWLFGACVLIVWAHLGRGVVISSLVLTIWATAALVMLSRDAPLGADEATRGDRLRRFGQTIGQAMSHRNTWLGLLLALVSGAGFEAVGAVAGPMLIDHGFTTEQVGIQRSVWVGLMLAGAWVGGMTSDRFGHRRCTGAYLLLLAGIIFAISATDGHVALLVMLAVLYLGIGLFIAASYALFMDLTDARIAGTQFSAFMGATNGCEMWAGLTVGMLAAALGYPISFTIMAGLSLLALPVLWWLRESNRANPSV